MKAPFKKQNNYMKGKSDGRSRQPLPPADSPPTPRASNSRPPASAGTVRDYLSSTCSVCYKSHTDIFFQCPTLPAIKSKKASLGAHTCPKFLHLKTPSGSCSNSVQPCHVRTSRDQKDHFNLLCTTQKKVNYRICTLCPAGKKPHDMRFQKVVLSFVTHAATHPVPQSLGSQNFLEEIESDSE